MSDYIKRSGLAEEVIDAFCGDCTQCGGHCRHDDLVEVIEHFPTISETEIIRKAFERVVERLEELISKNQDVSRANYIKGYLNGLKVARTVVKEEGGIE